MDKSGGQRMETVAHHVLDGERAIEPVVDDVHSGGGQLRANLVGDAGTNLHLQQGLLFHASARKRQRAESGDRAHRPIVLKVLKALNAIKAFNSFKAIKAIKALKALKAIKAPKAIKTLKTPKALKAVKAVKALKAPKAIKALKD